MAETHIQWATHVWNPTTGCDRISPGCDHCYALTMAARLKAMGQAKYQRDGDPRTSGPGFRLTCHPDTLSEPARWKKPRLVFVNSMSDLYHPDVPVEFIVSVFDTMANNGRHTFQVLTKRPQRMAAVTRAYYDGAFIRDWNNGALLGRPYCNVWLGTSIESDRYAFRADHLRDTPAAVRFLSLEPLIGPLPGLSLEGIDWVIVGGESGKGAREMDLDWVRDIRDRCRTAGVALFVKQLGGVWAITRRGHSSKAGDPEEWPSDLQIREWPASQEMKRGGRVEAI